MIVILSGPSAVGKSHLCDYAVEAGVPFITPLTTRPPRGEEVAGRDYSFVSEETFQRSILAGELAEWDFVLGNYYGTNLRVMEEAAQSGTVHIIHALARMAVRLRGRFEGRAHTVMLLPSSEELLVERLRSRGLSEDELALRIQHIREEIRHAPLFDQVIADADTEHASVMMSQVLTKIGRS